MAMKEKRKEYLYEYQKQKLKRIPLDVTKEFYEEIAVKASSCNMSVNGYIKQAIAEKIEREASLMEKDLYFAEVARFNENGFGEGKGWSFYVSPEKCNAFTVKAANEILEWAINEFKARFQEEMDFNFISLKMGDTKGKYWRDKNRLLIYKDGVPVYENNNGKICRDYEALADDLM